MRKTAAAGADLNHVDHRDLQRQAGAFLEAPHPAGLEIELVVRRAVLHQAHLGRGATHIERHNAVEAGQLRQERGGHRAGGGAGFDQPDREFLGLADRGDAAAGQHDVQMAIESYFG